MADLNQVRKKKEKKPPAGAPIWMLIYGDLVTQVLVFFILLFTVSEFDPIKARLMEMGFRRLSGPPDAPRPTPISEDWISDAMVRTKGLLTESGGVPMDFGKGEFFKVVSHRDGLKVSLEGHVRFEEGSPEPIFESEFDVIGAILREGRGKLNLIEVRGYTSASRADVSGGSHDMLAFLRAKAITDLLTKDWPDDERAIDPRRIRILSGGMNEPLDSNEDPVLRLRNQRVEIVISDKLVEFNSK